MRRRYHKEKHHNLFREIQRLGNFLKFDCHGCDVRQFFFFLEERQIISENNHHVEQWTVCSCLLVTYLDEVNTNK